MKINIYYGGRGLLDDPTLYVINKVTEVLEELRVSVERFNIYESKHAISTLPQTLKDADGIILAATVEWHGIGGNMLQFLDACWLYGDKEKISTIYMQPIVMSTTYGEREEMLTLEKAWEILGGQPCSGLCGYVDDLVSFQINRDYNKIIENKAETLYRTISQKIKSMPTSNQAVKQNIQRTIQLDLTPQESEQLSKYVADDGYVKQQKEDIKELTNMFKGLLGEKDEEDTEYIKNFQSHFVPQADFSANYLFMIEGKEKPLVIEAGKEDASIYYGEGGDIDVYLKLTPELLNNIMAGQITFQRAFMTGEMTAKGNFKTLRMLDNFFIFDR